MVDGGQGGGRRNQSCLRLTRVASIVEVGPLAPRQVVTFPMSAVRAAWSAARMGSGRRWAGVSFIGQLAGDLERHPMAAHWTWYMSRPKTAAVSLRSLTGSSG